jgi:peptide/nickel transport system substrate-binding protein
MGGITVFSMMRSKSSKTFVLFILMGLLISVSFSSVLRIGWTVEPDSLSPFIAYNLPAAECFLLLYDPLVALDENAEPVAKIAKSWELSEDNRIWTFYLNEGIIWHDGVPLTSEDVKYTYELFMNTGLGLYAGFLNGIESIECPDPYTVVFTTTEPKANMLVGNTPILPKHVWETVAEEDIEFWENEPVVGSGAFVYHQWEKGEYIHFKRNDDYFSDVPGVEEIIFILFANNDTLAQALKTGEISAGMNINPMQLPQLQQMSNIEAISSPGYGFTELAFNCWEDEESNGHPALRDKTVRQAIDWALDKKAILDISYVGQGEVGTTLVPPVLKKWHYQPSDSEIRSYDPEAAKGLLDASGYKAGKRGIRVDAEGNELSFRLYLRSSNTQEIKAGQMVKKYLQAIGIEAMIETMDDGLLMDYIYDNADFDMFIWGWGTDIDPTTIFNVMSSNEIGGLSDCYYSNEEYDKLLVYQATLMDEKERQASVYEMQRILYEESPYSILFYDNEFQAVRTDLFTGWKRIPENGSFFLTVNPYNYVTVVPR